MIRAQRRAAGFTLLEVVVAIALFSLLMTLVYSAFGTAVRAYEAGQTRTTQAESRRVVSEFLRNGLTAAFPVAVARDRKWFLLFEASDGRLRYVADLPGYVGVGGLHEIVITAEPRGERQALVLRRRPLVFDDEGEVTGEFHTRDLVEGVDGFALRFYGSEEPELPATWHEQWPPGQLMPMLVEVTISDGGATPWPVLRVRPRVDAIRYQGVGAGTGSRAPVPAAPPPAGGQARRVDGAERAEEPDR